MNGERRPPRVDVLFGLGYHPDRRVQRLATALAEAGYDVRILAWDREQALPAHDTADGIRIERARVRSRSRRGWTQGFFLVRVIPPWLRALRRDPPEAIHAVDLPMLVVALFIRPFLRRRAKLVFDAFEIYHLMEAHRYPRWVLRLIAAAEHRLPRLADAVITPGRARHAYFARHGVESVIVGNWLDPPDPRPDRAASRARLGVAEGAFCVVYAGGLEVSRDLRSLIDYARSADGGAVLVAGRGEQEGLCVATAATTPNFAFLGWLRDPSDLYAAADAIYYALAPDHPYAQYPAPNNLYAAIAYGVPLVYRPQGELAAMGEEAAIGVPFGDGRDVASAVQALEDPALRATLDASLATLRARYNWAEAKRELLTTYSDLLRVVPRE